VVRPETWREILLTIALGALTLSAMVVGSAFGNVHGPSDVRRAVAWVSAPALVFFGVLLIRRLARMLGHLIGDKTIPAAGAAVRLLVSAVGYVLILFSVFSILNVSVERLIVGGALTGVVLGIAAQQSLGNVFAGLVLLAARPFTVGDHIRVRSGPLGGQFEGIVLGISLTYVTLHTDGGPMKVPNSVMLAAAVGPSPVGPKLAGSPAPNSEAPNSEAPNSQAVPPPVAASSPITSP
jgi:small-conductance mechanosensitive channel